MSERGAVLKAAWAGEPQCDHRFSYSEAWVTVNHRLYENMNRMDGVGTGLALLAVAALATRLGDASSLPMWLIVLICLLVGVFHDVRRRNWGESVIFSISAGVLSGTMFAVASSRVGGGGDLVNFLSLGAGILVAGALVILLPVFVVLGRVLNPGASAVWRRKRAQPQPER